MTWRPSKEFLTPHARNPGSATDVNTYVCMYFCMHLCIFECIYMYVCTHVCMRNCIYVRNTIMYVCEHGANYVCMYVSPYICRLIFLGYRGVLISERQLDPPRETLNTF